MPTCRRTEKIQLRIGIHSAMSSRMMATSMATASMSPRGSKLCSPGRHRRLRDGPRQHWQPPRPPYEDMGEQHLKNIAKLTECGSTVWRPRLRPTTQTVTSGTAPSPRSRCCPSTNMSGDAEQEYSADGDDRRHHHRAVALPGPIRDRAQLHLHLQRPSSGCQAGGARPRRTLCGRRQRATPRWTSQDYRAAYQFCIRKPCLGRTI